MLTVLFEIRSTVFRYYLDYIILDPVWKPLNFRSIFFLKLRSFANVFSALPIILRKKIMHERLTKETLSCEIIARSVLIG